MKKALIVTAFARFVKAFLTNDILILQSKGYEVHCATNINHPGAECMPDYFNDMKVSFHQIDFSSNKPISKESLASIKQMGKLVKEQHFDVVHVHTPVSGAICRLACMNLRKKGLKVFYTAHGFYFHKESSKKTWILYHTIEDWLSRYSDAIITINHEDYENAKKMHCGNVFYIPGVGVDTKKFQDALVDRDVYRERLGISKEDFLVLAVGELSSRKNHRIVIEALAECKIPNAVFMICGNAMTTTKIVDEIKNLAKSLNVDLRLMGLRDDIPAICKCADVGVMPSTREGLGLSGIEMLASGLTIVASNVHGIVDYMMDGVNGYLADPYAHEFAVKIAKLKDTRDTLRVNCSNSVLKFDKSCSYKAMEKIYTELLK
jgi:glycosyltransferase involved in cell wall biosynthesis